MSPCCEAKPSSLTVVAVSRALYAYIDRLAEAEAEWPADRESVCKVCRCSYYLGATDLTEWKPLVEGVTDP
jgi:hypothetical protein